MKKKKEMRCYNVVSCRRNRGQKDDYKEFKFRKPKNALYPSFIQRWWDGSHTSLEFILKNRAQIIRILL